MNNLPDDLRALESQLGSLQPRHKIDLEQLAFQAGLAQACANQKRESQNRLLRYCTITSLASIAATVVALLSLSGDATPERLAVNQELQPTVITPLVPAEGFVHELPDVQMANLTLTQALLGTDWNHHRDIDGLPSSPNINGSDRERTISGQHSPSQRSPALRHLDWRRTIIEELGLSEESV